MLLTMITREREMKRDIEQDGALFGFRTHKIFNFYRCTIFRELVVIFVVLFFSNKLHFVECIG